MPTQPTSFSFGSTWLGGDDYGVLVIRGPYFVSPPVRNTEFEFAQEHGGVVYANRHAMRTINIPVVIEGDTFADLQDKIDALNLLFDPSLGDQNIQFDFLTDRFWSGRLIGEVQAPLLGLNAVEVELQFRCTDPLAQSSTLFSEANAIGTDPDTFTYPASGVIGGTRSALPVWTVLNSTGGTITDISLESATTGEEIAVEGATIDDGDIVRFDTERQIVEISTDGGNTYSSIMQYLSETQKTFPTLQHNVTNSITTTGISTGTLTAVWRERYA